jgi:L-asparaginase II
MARVAAAREDDAQVRRASAARLAGAMHSHPELVAGTEGACTLLMQACIGRTVVKTGAEGVYAGILPEQRLGIALKIADGATRASECAISALLVKLGVLDARHPVARRHLDAPILNRRDIVTGFMRVAPGFA